MKNALPILTTCCLGLFGSMAPGRAQEAPTWVPTLNFHSSSHSSTIVYPSSWDRVRIFWTVPSWSLGIQPQGTLPVTVVLETRQSGEGEWSELGRFPLKTGDYTNQTPWPDPPEILLPERILAPPPRSSSSSGDSITLGGSLSFLAGSSPPEASYTHHRLEPDTVYEYRMKAVNDAGDGPYSAAYSKRTQPLPPPERPKDSFVANLPGTGLTVMWTRSKHASEFLVERMSPGSGWIQVAVVEASRHAWTDLAVTPGLAYRYRVTARNLSGTSTPSTESSAVARRIRVVFDAPSGNDIAAPWQQRTGVVPGPGPEDSDRNVIWFAGAGSRVLTTRPMIFLLGGFLEFDFWTEDGQSSTNGIFVQASLDGSSWTDLGRISPEKNRGRWRNISIELRPDWSSPTVRFRLINTGAHAENVGIWAIRNVRVLAIQGAEKTAPRIQIDRPTERTTTQFRRSIKFAGKALDNRRLLGWSWSVNGGPWKSSRLSQGKLASWKGKIYGLKNGRNVVEVRAYDASGNLSTSKSRIVRIRRKAPKASPGLFISIDDPNWFSAAP